MAGPFIPGGHPSQTGEVAMAEIIDVVSASVTYICEASPNAVSSVAIWRCRKLTTTGGVTVTTWADGGDFSQIADNRASLTYT